MKNIHTTSRQAIATKYIGHTNFRGSRVKATCQARSITIGWDDALNSEENHAAAAYWLAREMGWLKYNDYAGGTLPDGTMAWVAVEKAGV